MTKYRQVPKTLVFQTEDFDDVDLISPESLFENFDNDDSSVVYLSSPEELFANVSVKEIKLKSPEELWGKKDKSNNNRNQSNRPKKNIK